MQQLIRMSVSHRMPPKPVCTDCYFMDLQKLFAIRRCCHGGLWTRGFFAVYSIPALICYDQQRIFQIHGHRTPVKSHIVHWTVAAAGVFVGKLGWDRQVNALGREITGKLGLQ